MHGLTILWILTWTNVILCWRSTCHIVPVGILFHCHSVHLHMLRLEQQLSQACVRVIIFNQDGILVSCPGATSCLVVSLQCLIHLFNIMHLASLCYTPDGTPGTSRKQTILWVIWYLWYSIPLFIVMAMHGLRFATKMFIAITSRCSI